ncbi:MAG: TIGR00341 family protein [Alphaproteobacteria bacterium]|nr:TIGR00341 family protein [Alphaproteobacteria bacterium]
MKRLRKPKFSKRLTLWKGRVKDTAEDIAEDISDSETWFSLRARGRWLRQWWQREYVSTINHDEVIQHVKSEGRLTSRYTFMVTMSCAIAMLGLLLSSPAVVIGAMLISPLMAPIMSLGFSLCLLDLRQMRKALEGLISGLAMALGVSALIVMLSPITETTPEIMARTQPNLFDLLVAIFSGMAGGYAVIKRKGEAIVGVAIATALMPPLAVVGYGLATHSAPIAQGAFMLFMTNLLAISLSVTLMAKFYGFGRNTGKKHMLWQVTLIGGVFAILSLPLGVALKDIAYQTYITKTAKSTIKEYFGEERSRISVFNIQFTHGKTALLDTVVLTSKYKSSAQTDLKKLLTDKTGKPINFSLDQIVVAQQTLEEAPPKPAAENAVTSALQPQTSLLSRAEEMTTALKQATFFPTEYINVNAEEKLATIHPKVTKGITIFTLRTFEQSMQTRYPSWIIQVIPPYQPLPFVYFEKSSDSLTPKAQENLQTIIWALRRWEAPQVAVVGFASSEGDFKRFDNTSLAYRRANSISERISQAGITAITRAEYHSFRQHADERTHGTNSFQRVEIRLSQPLEIPLSDTN